MGINKLKVVLTEEAQAFLDAQPFKAQQKRYEKSILAIKRNSIMAQMKLIPADNMKDKLWVKEVHQSAKPWKPISKKM